MSTRSYIALKENNTYKYIYCHHDGDTPYVGLELLKNFNTYEKVLELINKGCRSSIDSDSAYENEPFMETENFDELANNLGNIEYIYIFDKESNEWSVISEHSIYEKFFNYDVQEKVFDGVSYEFEKETLKTSVFNELKKFPQSINKLLAYELTSLINRLEKDPKYSEYYEGYKKLLNECLESKIITQTMINANNYDAEVIKDIADAEIKRLTKIADEERKRIYNLKTERANTVKSRTKTYDMKETAKLIKSTLTKNKIKSSVRSNYIYGVSIEVNKENIDFVKNLVNSMVKSNHEYEDAFDRNNELKNSYVKYNFGNYSGYPSIDEFYNK